MKRCWLMVLAVATLGAGLTLAVACGDDFDTSQLHAGECETDADCPVQGQECVESREQQRYYCTPQACDDDTDCSPVVVRGEVRSGICASAAGYAAPICVGVGTHLDGVPCLDEHEGHLRCAVHDSAVVLCDGGEFREVGFCPDEMAGCESHTGWSMVRCGERTEDFVDYAVAGQPCYGGDDPYSEGHGACSTDRMTGLSCKEDEWEATQNCAGKCQYIPGDAPECSVPTGCMGCAS